jgi:natural product precursor
MKTKTFEKKLSLNKKTVVDLDNREMKKIYGGISTGVYTCYPCTYAMCTEIC